MSHINDPAEATQVANSLKLITDQTPTKRELDRINLFLPVLVKALSTPGFVPHLDDIRRAFGIYPSEKTMEVDPSLTFEQRIELGNYDHVDKAIFELSTSPPALNPDIFDRGQLKPQLSGLCGFFYEIDSFLKERGDRRTATATELLTYAMFWPADQCRRPIIAYGTTFLLEDKEYFFRLDSSLFEGRSHRELRLQPKTNEIPEGTYTLAIPISGDGFIL